RRIPVRGGDYPPERPAEVARRGIVRSFQISAVFPYLTVLENVRIALQRTLPTTFQFWKPAASLTVLEERVHALLRQVDLGGFAQMRAVELPYGRKRALELATTLAMAPQL